MEAWEMFYTKEFHLEHDKVKVSADSLERLITVCKRSKQHELTLVVVSDCLGFSDYKKEDEYLKLENIVKVENVSFGSDNFVEDDWNSQIAHAVKDIMNKIKLYGPITNICEASVREHVSPVLSLSALIAEDIMMRAEQKVSGLRGNGPLDYMFLYKKFPITMTEVKDEDIASGIAQNDAQLVAGRQQYKFHLQNHVPELKEISKKRKYLDIDISSIPSFGIVSSGRDWMFQKLVEGEQTTIYKSKVIAIDLVNGDESRIRTELLVVVRHIVWMLKFQKNAVDLHPHAKKVRNEL